VTERKAIVSIVIGDGYVARWRRCCEQSWRAYAQKHGYDIVLFEQPLDDSARARSRSPAWQKLLVLGNERTAEYDRVVWVDADVVINPLAPDISLGVPLDAVGAVDEHRFPSRALNQRFVEAMVKQFTDRGQTAVADRCRDYLTTKSYYESWGVPGHHNHIVQTGVMVLSPRHHRQIFEKVYREYEDKGSEPWNYEMRPLSYELLENCALHWLDHRFNALVFALQWHDIDRFSGNMEMFLKSAFRDNHMLHFAAAQKTMDLFYEWGALPTHLRPTQIGRDNQIGRNEMCPCGSGKRYKHCHGSV
jgi:hypothetical protein